MGLETVTVLCTDLVDSTGVLARLGPEAMEALRREHFRLLRLAMRRSEREVKNLGDGLMAVFSSAATAVDVAVAMQQAVTRSCDRRGVEVETRDETLAVVPGNGRVIGPPASFSSSRRGTRSNRPTRTTGRPPLPPEVREGRASW
jgi:class 3 adenylate cyclase